MLRLSDSPMTWLFTGDSITQAVFHTHGARGWVEHCHEHIRGGLGRLEDVVINTGMSGWTAPMVLERYDHLVARFRPDVVSIALGTNDAHVDDPGGPEDFEATMRDMVTRSQQIADQVVVHTPAGIAWSGRERRPDLEAYAAGVRRLARDLDVPLVDHAAHWFTAYPACRFGNTEPLGWLDDAIHPNADGHRVMADLAIATLLPQR